MERSNSKKQLTLLKLGLLLLIPAVAYATVRYDAVTISQSLGIGTTSPSSKAALEISSTTKGLLPPRMTTAQRDAIAAVPEGLKVHNTTTHYQDFYDGTNWMNGLAMQSRSTSTGVLQVLSGVVSAASVAAGDVTGILGVSKGGTGLSLSSSTGPLIVTAGTVSATSIALASQVSGTLPIANGGTNNAALLVTAGGVPYTDGSKFVNVGAGTTGQILYSNGASPPTWQDNSAAIGYNSSETVTNLGLSTSVSSSALTISLKQKDGSTNPAAGSGAVYASFLTTTSGAASFATVSVTSALSMTLTTNATLGHASAVNEYIYVYLINNAGTAELAAGTYPIDEGTVISTTALSGSSGQASVVYSTSSRSNVSARLIARLKSNQTSAGWWTSAPSEVSLIPFDSSPSPYPISVVQTDSPNGYGSTSTKVRKYSNSYTVGTAITYGTSATLGDTFTINEDGVYFVEIRDATTTDGFFAIGISLNTTLAEGLTSINSLPAAKRIVYGGPRGSVAVSASTIIRLRAGDILRAQTDASQNPTTNTLGVKIMKLFK